MSWSSKDPNFDLTQFYEHLRETKPPFECPYCKRKYRSFNGIQMHISSIHANEIATNINSRHYGM